MKLITRDTDYALRAACFIARQRGAVVTVAQLVKALKMPGPFLRKLLQALNRKKVLRSYKGSGGGFLLARPAEKIYLTELINIFQGPLKLNECFFKKALCPNRRSCALKKKIDEIENYVVRRLRLISVGSLIKG